jgi:hypothetical protein
MLNMAFQVVEFTVDSENEVLDRRVIPYRYMTYKDAVARSFQRDYDVPSVAVSCTRSSRGDCR